MQFDRQTLSIAMRFLMAKTPEQMAAVDLDTHYTQVRFHSFIPYHMMMMLVLSIIHYPLSNPTYSLNLTPCIYAGIS